MNLMSEITELHFSHNSSTASEHRQHNKILKSQFKITQTLQTVIMNQNLKNVRTAIFVVTAQF